MTSISLVTPAIPRKNPRSHVHSERGPAEGELPQCALPAAPFLTSRKLLQEIEQKAAFSQQQITIVKAQMAAKAREQRMLQLTSSEVDSLPKDTNVYEGVGKM